MHQPKARIVLDVKDADASRSIVKSGPNTQHVSILRHVAHARPGPDVWSNIEHELKFIQRGGLWHHPKLKKALDDIETFHLFGGGYINRRWPATAFYLGLGAAIKKHTGAKVAATGLGLMPFATAESQEQRDLLSCVLDGFDIFEARDTPSAHAVGSEVARLDDAFLIPHHQWITACHHRHQAPGARRQAQEECSRLITALKSGNYVEPTKQTVTEFLDEWLKFIKPSVSLKTHAEILQKGVAPLLGDVTLAKLKTDRE